MVRLEPQRVSWICKVVPLENVGTSGEVPTGFFLGVERKEARWTPYLGSPGHHSNLFLSHLGLDQARLLV